MIIKQIYIYIYIHIYIYVYIDIDMEYIHSHFNMDVKDAHRISSKKNESKTFKKKTLLGIAAKFRF